MTVGACKNTDSVTRGRAAPVRPSRAPGARPRLRPSRARVRGPGRPRQAPPIPEGSPRSPVRGRPTSTESAARRRRLEPHAASGLSSQPASGAGTRPGLPQRGSPGAAGRPLRANRGARREGPLPLSPRNHPLPQAPRARGLFSPARGFRFYTQRLRAPHVSFCFPTLKNKWNCSFLSRKLCC